MDALRAWAAVGVVVVHVYSLNRIVTPPAIAEVVNKFGLGVELFFALSAFCLAVGYFGKLGTEETIRRFMVRRLFRIAPLMYFMIAFWTLEMTRRYGEFPGWDALVLNVTFLFGLIPGKAEGIVWASWSLGVEMLFYLVFPLLCIFVKSWRSAAALLLVTLIVSIGCRWAILDGGELPKSFARQNIVTASPYFVMGLLAYFVWRRLSGLPQRRIVSHLLLGGSLAWWVLVGLSGLGSLRIGDLPVGHYAIGLAFPALILSQALHPTSLLVNPATVFVGLRGYSVYLLHPAVILYTMPLVRWIYGSTDTMKSGDWSPFIWSCLAVTAITIFLADVAYRLIEKPGVALGKRLLSRTASLPAPSPSPQTQAL
ncbi:acyltransferase [Mesorhizobium sp. YM1C-6-2]|uniref:acyltransferase family protein n=1 Tax=Mesorhizobium sp. YM1C-6-2 TaxID=1827501 RepID=UPI001603BAF6|nr:acyltransferase [Mesorhizobium sp. YM1C-6-2]